MACSKDQLSKILPAADYAFVMEGEDTAARVEELITQLEKHAGEFVGSLDVNQATETALFQSLEKLNTTNLKDNFKESKNFDQLASPEERTEESDQGILSDDEAWSNQVGRFTDQLEELEARSTEATESAIKRHTEGLARATKTLEESTDKKERGQAERAFRTTVFAIDKLYNEQFNKNEALKNNTKAFLDTEKNRETIIPTLREAMMTMAHTHSKSAEQTEMATSLVEGAQTRIKLGDDQQDVLDSMLEGGYDYYTKYDVDSASVYLSDAVDDKYLNRLRSKLPGIGNNLAHVRSRMVVDNMRDSMYQVKEKATSLLAVLPGVHHYLSNSARRNQMLGNKPSPQLKVGIDDFLILRDQVEAVINDDILDNWDNTEKGALGEKKGNKPAGEYFIERLNYAPLNYFRNTNDQGTLPSNLMTAITAEMQSWVAENARDTLFNDKDDIASILGLSSANQVGREAEKTLREAGTLRSNTVNQIGKAIYKHLNLKTIDSVEGNLQSRLYTSLGQLAIETGFKLDLFESMSVPRGQFRQWRREDNLSEEDKNSKEPVYFIRAKSKKVGKASTLETHVEKMVADYGDVSPMFEAMFNMKGRVMEPVEAPNPVVKASIRGTLNKISASAKAAVKALQAKPFIAHEGMRNTFNQMSRKDYLEGVMGWVDPNTLNVTERDSQEGKNLGYEKNYDALKEYFDSVGNEKRWFNFSVKKNMRSMIDSVKLNYQSNHMHRASIIDPTWEETIQLDSQADLNDFKIATGLWMDTGVDKALEDDSMFAKVDELMESPEVKPAWEMLIDKDPAEAYTAEETAQLVTAIKKTGGHGPHVLAALHGWAAYQDAVNKGEPSFTHAMAMEVDGLTNGLAISLVQTPATFTPTTRAHHRDLLNRVGIFFKANKEGTDYTTSYAQAKARNKDMEDNYQGLARKIGAGISKIISGEKGRAVENEILPAELSDKAAKAHQKKRDTAFQQRVIADRLALLIPSFYETDPDGNLVVSKAGRQLAKDPVLQSNYGAQKKAVEYNLVRSPYTSTIKKMMDIANSADSDATKAALMRDHLDNLGYALSPLREGNPDTIQGMYALAGMKHTVGDDNWKEHPDAGDPTTEYTPEYIINYDGPEGKGPLGFAKSFKLTDKQVDLLAERGALVYGEATWDGLNDMLGHQWAVRDKIISAMSVMNGVYAHKYQEARDAWVKDNGKQPTSEVEQEIKEILRNQGLLPSIRHPGSDEASLDPNFETQMEITNEAAIRAEGAFKSSTLNSSTPFDSGSHTTTQALMRNMPNMDIGMKGYVLATQAMDAHIIHMISKPEKNKSFHIFDAFISGLKDNLRISKDANQIFYDENKKYNLMREVETSLKRFEKEFHKLPVETQEDILGNGSFEGLEGNFFEDFKDTNKRVQAERTELFGKNGIYNVNQYNRPGAHYTVGTPEVATGEVYGSSAVGPDPAAEGDREVSNLETDRVQEIYNGLKGYENQTLDGDHQAQLDKVVSQLIVPGTSKVDKVIQQVFIRNPAQARNLGEYDPATHQVTLEASKNQLNNPIDMSLQETAVHEWVHALLVPALKDPDAYWSRNELEKIFNRAREVVLPEHFIARDAEGNIIGDETHARAAAENFWQYVFNNPQGHNLHEFAALGLTNKPFADALATIDFDPEVGETGSKWDWNNILQSLWDVAVRAFQWMSRKEQEGRKGNIHGELFNFTKNTIAATQNQRTILGNQAKKVSDTAAGLLDRANKFPREAAVAKVESFFGVTSNNPAHIKTRRQAFKDLAKDNIERTSEGITSMLESHGLGSANFAKELWQEVAGLPKAMQHWRTLKIASLQKVDAPRKRIAETISDAVLDTFDPAVKLSKDTWQALTDVVMKTDMVSLTKAFSTDQIIEFLSDPQILANQVSEYEQQLEKLYGRNGTFYRNSAHVLGRMMATGLVGDDVGNPMVNADNIVKMLSLNESERTLTGDIDNAREIIDRLASLRAIEHTAANQKSKALEVFQHERSREDGNGTEMLMAYHDSFKTMSEKENFTEGNTSMWKGHTSQKFDERVSIETKPVNPDQIREMEKKGYVLHSTLGHDPTLKDGQMMGLYVSSIGQDTFKKGVVSLTSLQNRGTDLLDLLQNSLKAYGARDLKNSFDGVHQKNMNLARNLFKPDLNVLTSTKPKLIPIVSPKNGAIVNYRYIMSEENKKNILKNDQEAHRTIGRMFGSISDKTGTSVINDAVLKSWNNDWKNHGKASSKDFRYLSATSPDKEAREIYKMLPEEMKESAKKYFGQVNPVIPIRKDMFMYVLGNREVSIAGKLQKTNEEWKTKIPLRYLEAIRTAEEVWKEIVSFARMKGSILLPDVVMNNMLSNLMVLGADGIPPNYIKQKFGESIHAMRRFQKQRQELDTLTAEVIGRRQRGDNVTNMEGRIAFLEAQLATNPVSEMIDHGLFSAIVEDVSAEAFEPSQKHHIAALFEKVPDFLKAKTGQSEPVDRGMELVREGLMTPGSKIFSLAVAANQYGDFSARYIKFKYNTEVQKMDTRKAINESLDAFIFYDEPTTKILQIANDYGFLMFTKFYLRIQRVILKLFMEKPANMVGLHALQEVITDVPDITQDILSPDGISNRMHLDPLETIDKAMGFPMAEWIKYPFVQLSKAFG